MHLPGFLYIKDQLNLLPHSRLKAFKSIVNNDNRNFAGRALKCIATDEVSLFRVEESYGMHTNREFCFNEPKILPMTDKNGVFTIFHTGVPWKLFLYKSYLQAQWNAKKMGDWLTTAISSLTICTWLRLTNVVDTIRHFYTHIFGSNGYYIFEQVSKLRDNQVSQRLDASRRMVKENVELEGYRIVRGPGCGYTESFITSSKIPLLHWSEISFEVSLMVQLIF